MKKVLFLMFLLFLMVLGTANVKAQVRIGGNAVPNAAAVLDLNATDATNDGTKGLALPRVNLTTNTMQLTTGVANLTGMLVYNTTATLGAIGIYFWNGNNWIKASLPSTSAADSGKILMSNGINWVPTIAGLSRDTTDRVGVILASSPVTTWNEVVNTSINIKISPNKYQKIDIPGLPANALCLSGLMGVNFAAGSSLLYAYLWTPSGSINLNTVLKCYVASN